MRETKYLEFKTEITNTFLKTVSAFANYNGGEIIFGINDEGTAIGMTNPVQACLDIENKINDSIRPQPVYELEVNDKDKTVHLKVYEGNSKPYTYKSKAYRRNDTATIEVDELEFSRLVLKGRNVNYEQLPANEQNLTFNVLGALVKNEIGIEVFNKDILKTLNLYSDKEGYNIAAELLADKNSFCGIDLARFGESISVILKRETIEHMSLLSELERAIQIYRDFYQYEKIEGIEREKVERIPEQAFREALANGLIHRTWDVKSRIRVMMYGDRIEIISPGGLPAGISDEEYLKGNVSLLRNPILANVFYRLHIVEILGTGITRIRESYRDSVVKPAFEVYENSIKVILPVSDAFELTRDEAEVYKELGITASKSIGEITERVSFGRSKVAAILKRLADKHYIIIQGNGRGTKYKRNCM
ncbi:MAG: AAA family ATPase [Schwartzia succinivorans]|uniref:ATP-binding protein n=1 Tax=Schwartzia succinivorans TaxID=55507 RepID=UPI002356B11D|nr:ATP-binding protein [Schwartzia succinivorans]MBE6096649.1 AAA family ATPase [Schwartzia succinivorans]